MRTAVAKQAHDRHGPVPVQQTCQEIDERGRGRTKCPFGSFQVPPAADARSCPFTSFIWAIKRPSSSALITVSMDVTRCARSTASRSSQPDSSRPRCPRWQANVKWTEMGEVRALPGRRSSNRRRPAPRTRRQGCPQRGARPPRPRARPARFGRCAGGGGQARVGHEATGAGSPITLPNGATHHPSGAGELDLEASPRVSGGAEPSAHQIRS